MPGYILNPIGEADYNYSLLAPASGLGGGRPAKLLGMVP